MKYLVFALLVSQSAQADCSVIRAGRLYDGLSDKIRSHVEILIRKGRVARVSKSQSAPIKGCEIVDLSSSFVMPGLIDSHTHLMTDDRSYAHDFPSELLRIASEPLEKRVAEGRERARDLLMGGITTVRDLGNSGQYIDVKLRDAIERGDFPGPRIFASGPGIAVGKAQFPRDAQDSTVRREYSILRDEVDIAKELRAHIDAKVDFLKVYADNDPGVGSMPRKWIREIIRLAHARKLKVAVHVTTKASAVVAVTAQADSIEHLTEADDEIIASIVKRGIYVVMTDFSRRQAEFLGKKNPDYSNPLSYIAGRSKVSRAVIAGGAKIAFGSDAYVNFTKEGMGWEESAKQALYSYADQGIENLRILRAATRDGAELLDRPDLGVVREGGIADIIAVNGDPLKDIHDLSHVSFVMKDGFQYLPAR